MEPQDFAAWNSFVDEHPAGTIFHTTYWLEMIDPGIEIHIVYINEEIRAGVALIKSRKNALTGYHIPPYTQYFSPLYKSKALNRNTLTEEHECIRLILEMIRNAKHVDFKLPRGHQSILPYHWKGFESSVSITHTVTGTMKDYLQELNKNKLRELNKLLGMAEEGHIIIENIVNETELIQLLKQTEERKGFNAKPALTVKLIMKSADSFAKKIVIRSIQHGPIAVGFFPYDSKCVYNLVNASSRVSDPVLKTINLLLLYKAIEFALNSGRTFDFEGSMLPGVEAFCRLMGGKQVPVYRVQKSSSLQYSLLRAAKQIKNDRRKT